MNRCITPTNYWLKRVESDKHEAECARRAETREGDGWFIPGLAACFMFAMWFAWSPTLALGVTALLHSLTFTAGFVVLFTTAYVSTHRLD